MCAGVQKQLKRFGYEVETVSTVETAYQRVQENVFSLILVDLMLGKEDGITLVCQLRAGGVKTPIAMYSVHDSEIYETAALRLGADEYILKTASISHLAARIHANLAREDRHAGHKPSIQRRIAVGRFILDRHAQVLESEGKIVKLTERETMLIDLLSQDTERTFPFKQLVDDLWGPKDLRKSEAALHAMIKRLRQKLDKEIRAKDLIENNHGRGFRLSQRFLQQTNEPGTTV
jgi:DNA-binding response OmpR family regulator